MYLYILIIVGAVALDQLVKYLVVRGMALGESIPVIDGVFHITRFHNTGAAFSSFEGQRVLLIALPCILITAGLIYMWRHKEASRMLLVPVAMIIGGGIGNLVDRAWLGYVVDMFDFRVFPIFNVADSFVTVGCILLCIYVLISPDSKKKEG